MGSSAQALTNHQNSLHSTGPRTPEGKRASSLNSLRHGLTSQRVILPGEDHAPYNAFRAKLLAELAPKSTVEEMIAGTVCETQWRLERARKAEANIIALAHHEDLPASIAFVDDPEDRNALIEAYAHVKYERALHNIQIQEARLQRLLYKSLEEFRNEQINRRRIRAEQLTHAINARTWYQANERKFTPADGGFVFTIAEIDREIERRYMQANPNSPYGIPKVKTYAERRDKFLSSVYGNQKIAA